MTEYGIDAGGLFFTFGEPQPDEDGVCYTGVGLLPNASECFYGFNATPDDLADLRAHGWKEVSENALKEEQWRRHNALARLRVTFMGEEAER